LYGLEVVSPRGRCFRTGGLAYDKEIKMEEEKISRVLEWLTLKEVKDIQKFLESANYYL